VSCRGCQADFLRVFSRVLGSMGLRGVKVTGVQLRVVLRNHRSGRCFRAFLESFLRRRRIARCSPEASRPGSRKAGHDGGVRGVRCGRRSFPMGGASEVDGIFCQPRETEPSGGRVGWYFAVRNRASACALSLLTLGRE